MAGSSWSSRLWCWRTRWSFGLIISGGGRKNIDRNGGADAAAFGAAAAAAAELEAAAMERANGGRAEDWLLGCPARLALHESWCSMKLSTLHEVYVYVLRIKDLEKKKVYGG